MLEIKGDEVYPLRFPSLRVPSCTCPLVACALIFLRVPQVNLRKIRELEDVIADERTQHSQVARSHVFCAFYS